MKTLKEMSTELGTCITTTKIKALESSAFVKIGRKAYVDEDVFYDFYRRKTQKDLKRQQPNTTHKRKEA